MDDKRLQEIKDGDWMLHGTEEWTNQEDADTEAVIKELIAAYEQAQAELADLQLRYDNQREDCIDYVKDIADLRKQLAEAQAELAEARDIRDRWKDYSKLYKGYANKWSKDNADLRKQLAEATLERDKWERQSKNNGGAAVIALERMEELEAKLAEAQAD